MNENAVQTATRNNGDTGEMLRGVTLTPRVDILENENELLLIADMPGVKHADVDVRYENEELTLHGRRACTVPDSGFDRQEIQNGDYFRSFRISEKIDAEQIWADMKLGVLTLHLPKSEKAKPRKISVKAG